MRYSFLLVFFVLSTLHACSQRNSPDGNDHEVIELSEYWHGVAEVTVYELSQNRYNNNHPGQIVSVWVKEDFLTDKQVKNDRYQNSNSVPVMKNIQSRKFTTGVYDYSMLSSVFTPLNLSGYPPSIKASGSSQEWCGHGYIQYNIDGNKYKVTEHSYFEDIADRAYKMKKQGILEDEIFNLIRMSPTLLPIGDFDIIPSVNYVQLRHIEANPFKAKASKSKYTGDEFSSEFEIIEYKIHIPELSRMLQIYYENSESFRILGWMDSYPSAFDNNTRTTVVKRTKTQKIKYWERNALQDTSLRKQLGLIY